MARWDPGGPRPSCGFLTSFLFPPPHCVFLFANSLMLGTGKEQEWPDPCLLPGILGEVPSTFSGRS